MFALVMAGLAANPAAQPAALLPAVDLRVLHDVTGDVWPADMNRDGRTDLVHGSNDGVAVSLGHGNGTFASAVGSGVDGQVLAVGDVNGDRRTDVVAQSGDNLVILPGTGAGSLDAPHTVLGGGSFTFASVADMDNDGIRDLVVGQEGAFLHVLPGNGDFTFDPTFTFDSDAWPHGHFIADFDDDGLRDIVVAHRYTRRLTIFRNGGTFVFTPTDLPIQHSSSDVTARDLNGDGDLDLVVSARGERDDWPWDFGLVYVYLGNGDGTFDAPATFATAAGTHSVVVGDFTRDGTIDVATANRSAWYYDSLCGLGFQNVDSVSLLPGAGDGTFGPAVNFALEPIRSEERQRFQDVVGTLNTSDLNRDGHVDLLTTNGALLLNAAPRANRAPVVSAGEDHTVLNEPEAYLRGDASDPDHHLLRVQWSEDRPTEPTGLHQNPTCRPLDDGPGRYTFYFSANDGHGGVTSDSVVVDYVTTEDWPNVFIGNPSHGSTVTEGEPLVIDWSVDDEDAITQIDVAFSADNGATFEPVDGCTELPGTTTECTWNDPGPATERGLLRVRATDAAGHQGETHHGLVIAPAEPGELPEPWTNDDVGAVEAPGSAAFDAESGRIIVRGSGADIWGTADELHWIHQPVTGDFQVSVKVWDVQNVDVWTKAGLMVREGTAAGARHASIFMTPSTTKGIAFQRRTTANGASVHTYGPAADAPYWIRLKRTGNVVSAYTSPSGQRTDWTLVGRQTFAALRDTLEVGVAVTSHRDGAVAEASFDEPVILRDPFWWTQDIGAVGLPGSTDYTNFPTAISMQGSGTDIWGTADAFRFHNVEWTLDGAMTSRVQHIERTHDWAKAGVMFRETLDAGSRHVMLIVSAARGLAMQYRSATGGTSANVALDANVTAPEWVRLTRSGNTFTGYASEDGTTWRTVGSITVAMSGDAYAGLVVTSHNNTTLATGEFDQISVTR